MVRRQLSRNSVESNSSATQELSIEERTLTRFQLLERLVGLKEAGAFSCVNCDEWMVPVTPGAMERVCCPSCEESFCAKCRRRPFHYGCTCEEVDDICERWREWAAAKGVTLHELEQRMKEYDDMET